MPKINLNLSYMQKILLSALAVSSVFLLTFFPSRLATKNSQPLRVYFFNVGQGDSALILTPSGQSVLIDGGPDTQVLGHLDKINAYWDRRIDYLLLTHAHADHLAGLVEVLKTYQVGAVLWNNVAYDSPYLTSWVKELANFSGEVASFEEGDTLKLGEVSLKAIWPPKNLNLVENLNNTSIVTHLKYKDFDCLLTGDIEGDVQPLVDWPQKVEVLKVPHHGGAGDTSESLLKAARPFTAVISVGENSYGQPAPETLETLSRYGVDTYRTDKHGSVEVITNGHAWQISID